MTRPPLTPALLFGAALELVDAEGLEALTMRRLAAALGVATMSLYSHVPNKEDLLAGLVNQATAEIRLPPPGTEPWDALRMITREFRRVAQLHPNLVPLIALNPPRGLHGLRTLEAAFDAIRRAGVGADRAAQAYRLSASFAIGFVVLECGGFFRPLDSAGATPGADGPLFADLPRIAEMAPHLAEWDSDREFEAGMDGIIGVLAGYASPGD